MNSRTLVIVSGIVAVAPLVATNAWAKSHRVEGCVKVYDESTGGSHGLAKATVEAEYVNILGLKDTYRYQYETDSSGCFDFTVTDAFVPDETSITVYIYFENDLFRVQQDDGDIYGLDFGTQSVGAGDAANFGTWTLKYVDSSHYTVAEKHYRAAWLFRNMYRATRQYDSLLGKSFSDESYAVVKLVYPSDQCVNISCASEGKIHIYRENSENDAYDRYNTLLHEWGHWIARRDAGISTQTIGDYCQNHASSSFPGSKRPYLYEDPDYGSGNCGHGLDSWELAGRVSAEGYAEALADFLEDGECGNDYRGGELLSGFDGDFGHADALNFDKLHRDRNGYRFYCGMFNGSSGGKTWMHSYADEGALESFVARGYTTDASANSRHAYVAKDRMIYRIKLSTGDESEFDEPSRLFSDSGEVQKIAASDDAVCITYDTKKIACRQLLHADSTGKSISSKFEGGASSPEKGGSVGLGLGFKAISLSSNIYIVQDIALVDDQLYVLSWEHDSSGWHWVVNRNSATSGSWSPTVIYSQDPSGATGSDYRSLAVSESQDRLFLARTYSIDSCAIASCGSVSNWSGSSTYRGYYRESRLNSFYYIIWKIFVSGDHLYIRDEYGVARIDLDDKSLEQHIGIGADRVFVNNLSLRSMGFAGDHLVYATNGTDSLLEISHVIWDDQRKETDPSSVMIRYHVNEDATVTRKYYCGAESVQVNPYDVAHAFKGIWFYSSLTDVGANIPGVSTSETGDLKNAAWASLSSEGCTWAGSGEYRDDDDSYIPFEDGEEPSSWKVPSRVLTAANFAANRKDKEEFEAWQRHHRLDPKGVSPEELMQDEKRGATSSRNADIGRKGTLEIERRLFKKTGALRTK